MMCGSGKCRTTAVSWAYYNSKAPTPVCTRHSKQPAVMYTQPIDRLLREEAPL